MTMQEELQKPFLAEEIEWRIQSIGQTKNKQGNDALWAILVPYVTNRAIQERLDAVCGVENWRNEFAHPNEKTVLCGISIKVGSDWITKWDGASNTDIDAVKGGLSGSMKRSAVQWGIGRYLYRLESAFVYPQTDKPQSLIGWETEYAKLDPNSKKKTRIFYKRPTLPAWALQNDPQ